MLAERPELGLEWRADSQRHVAPPKTSQFEAELHGMLDAAMGPGATPATVQAALGVSLREAGSFLDTTIADIDNPGQRMAQPGVTFHTTPTAEDPEVREPGDLPDGAQLTPGQYVRARCGPAGAAVSARSDRPRHLADVPGCRQVASSRGPLRPRGDDAAVPGDWPELVPFRLVLESGPELGAIVEDHVVRVTLPPGEQLRVRLASSIRREALDLMGLWASLPAVIRDNPFLREVAADGWFWWLTPPTEMRFVHAVPRPIEVPRPTILVPVRAPGDTAVVLFGAVDLHGPSTERIDIEASWSQWVDDVTKPAPERVSGTAAACGTSVASDEDLVVLSAADASIPLPGGGVLRLHAAVHQTGDTLHRHVDYRVRATTRYREYFHPQLTPSPDDLSVVGPVRTLNVPSSARPAKVIVRDVLPLFRWHEETEPGHPFGLRRTRKTGLRLYLERPWYLDRRRRVPRRDPRGGRRHAGGGHGVAVGRRSGVPSAGSGGPLASCRSSDLLHLTGLDDRVEPGRPAGAAGGAAARRIGTDSRTSGCWPTSRSSRPSGSSGSWTSPSTPVPRSGRS